MSSSSCQKVVLITGCSSGFGMLAAARLASHNYTVIATMRNLNKSGALTDELKRRNASCEIKQLDVTNKESIQSVVQFIGDEYGQLDILVNNAGYGIGGFFEDLSEDEIRQQMETNFFGVQNVIREAIPLMRPRKQGRIINISSVAGFSASPCFGAYNASKWALEGFSESLRHELKFFGIDVLLIEPGTYNTKIFHDNARYAQGFDNPDSPYAPISEFLKKKTMDYVEDCHKDPEEVPALVEKLITLKNPSFRNVPDVEAQTLGVLRKILPFRMYSWMIRSALFHKMKLPPASGHVTNR